MDNPIPFFKAPTQPLRNLGDEFNKILPSDKKVVIFLDDLDRCENDNVLNLLSAIYNVFYKSEKIIIIAGIDF